MDMLNLLIGAAAGFAGGYALRGKSDKSESQFRDGTPYSTLYNEAQSELSKVKSELRSRDAEIEELNQRVKSLTRKLRNWEDKAEDKADDIDDMKKTIDSLRRQNEDLSDKMNDYKSLYTAAQQEIERLKS